MTAVLINPSAARLGRANAILTASGARHYQSDFTGPLSLKAVIEGQATWETRQGRFELVPGSVLVLNDGEEYTITVDALQPVETFCFFFARGFVEDAFRATTAESAALLDDPVAHSPVTFIERVRFDAPLVTIVRRARARFRNGEPLDESFHETALELVRAQCDVAARVERLPALRSSTREELARRVGVATSYLHANLDRAVTVAEAAREACLSPFHFHRLFASFHGTTPHRYVTRLRLERARAALQAGDRPVADVALECGFESLGSFTTLFKRTFGVTPGQIRRNGESPRAIPDLP